MRTVISNKIYVYNASVELYFWAQDNLVIINPTWQQMKKMGKDDLILLKHIPQKMKLYIENGSDLIFPFGVLYAIWPMIKNYPYELRFNDNGQVIDQNMKISMPLFDYQEEAVQKLLAARCGVLESAAGSGKTQIGIELAKRIGRNCLWLCHTSDLLEQTVKRIHLLYPNLSVGTITDGSVNMVKNGITVSTIQTLVNVDPDVYKDVFDTIITDECFSGDTEILTNEGFKRFDSLTKNEMIAQYENGQIEFVKPIRFIERDTDQYMVFKHSDDINIITTLNHNMVALNEHNKEIVRPAIDFLNNKLANYKMITKAKIKDYDSTQMLSALDRIKIMLQADGCLYYKSKSDNFDTYKLEFSKERKIKRFKELCEMAHIEYKEYKERKFENKKCHNSIKFCIKMPKNENRYKILTDFLEQPRNVQYALDILEEVSNWDGHLRQYNYDNYGVEYDSVIKENVDFVQMCAFLANKKHSKILAIKRKNKKYKDIYRVYFGTLQECCYGRFAKEIVQQNIPVYCVEVPSHKIVVKKNGFIFICGNCHHVNGSPTLRKMFVKVLEKIPARYKYGLSATPERADTMIKTMYATIGCSLEGKFEPTFTIDRSRTRTLTAKHIRYNLDTEWDYSCLNEDGTFNYSALVDFLGKNQQRNENIVENIIKVSEKHKKQLVLCQRIEQCETINDMLLEKGINSVLLVGKVTKKRRKEILNGTKDWNVIVATMSLAKEGLDYPELSCLHWAMTISDKTATVQSAGRIERVYEGKPDPEIYDYVDINYPYCIGKYKKRATWLRKR